MHCIPSAAGKHARVATTANTCFAGVDEAAATAEAVVLQNLLNVISRQTLPLAPAKSKPAKPSDPDNALDAPLHDPGMGQLTRCR